MSRASLQNLAKIDRPLTDDEKDYLRSRARGWEVDVNESRFPPREQDWLEDTVEDGEMSPSQAIPIKVKPANGAPFPVSADPFREFDENMVREVRAMSFNDLRAEVKERGLPVTGTKQHLQVVLLKAEAQAAEE